MPTTLSTAWFLDTHVTFRAASSDIFVLESLARHGDSPPLHVHRTEDELFVLLDGAMTLALDAEPVSLHVGDAVLAPKGVPHTYRVDSDTARWLAVTTNGDFEGFVREVSRNAQHEGLPERAEPPAQEQVQALADIAARYGIEFVGPPLS